MNNKNQVHVSLLTTNKSGILSSMMFSGRKMGLQIKKNKSTKIDDASSRLTIQFEGNLNCTVLDFINEIESHPGIHKVESIESEDTNTASNQNPEDKANESINISNKLKALDTIDKNAISIIENSLISYLGPVAPVLIESALPKCHSIGDLFKTLSNELNGKEKEDFLSLVDLKNTSFAEAEPSNTTSESSPLNNSKIATEEQSNKPVYLLAHDLITKESLQVAEEKLTKVLGPVAPILVQSAAEETKHIGDLYLLLSKELEGAERNEFLELVKGIDLRQF